MTVEYNKTDSGFFTRCGDCDAKVSGGEPVYIPNITENNVMRLAKPICEKCYEEKKANES